MKKKFIEPEIEIISVDLDDVVEDIICRINDICITQHHSPEDKEKALKQIKGHIDFMLTMSED